MERKGRDSGRSRPWQSATPPVLKLVCGPHKLCDFWYNRFVDLMTIGYEGLTSEAFFQLLLDARVGMLVDVRQNPISRKPGFRKNALAETASQHGISYVHLAEFGCPRTVRDDYREDSDWERYTERYLEYLASLTTDVAQLGQMARVTRCCLMCFEADPLTCHRLFVAERVAQTAIENVRVIHLRSALVAKNQNLCRLPRGTQAKSPVLAAA